MENKYTALHQQSCQADHTALESRMRMEMQREVLKVRTEFEVAISSAKMSAMGWTMLITQVMVIVWTVLLMK